MNPPVVQPALFDEQQTPTGDCPQCCGPDGSPNGKWPDKDGRCCPNCGGSRTAKVPF